MRLAPLRGIAERAAAIATRDSGVLATAPFSASVLEIFT
jgi:hypothetical protein